MTTKCWISTTHSSSQGTCITGNSWISAVKIFSSVTQSVQWPNKQPHWVRKSGILCNFKQQSSLHSRGDPYTDTPVQELRDSLHQLASHCTCWKAAGWSNTEMFVLAEKALSGRAWEGKTGAIAPECKGGSTNWPWGWEQCLGREVVKLVIKFKSLIAH